ncbi:MAG TPA: GreA/GreB family elongation factor [Candidatus Limnocylindrales bacterium]
MTAAAWQSLSSRVDALSVGILQALERRSRPLTRQVKDDGPVPVWLIEQEQARLARLQADLRCAQVVDPDGRAVIGARVTLRDANGTATTYTVVVPGEGDPTRSRVPADSALGRLLLGRRAGAVLVLKDPAGPRELVVVAVDYPGATVLVGAARSRLEREAVEHVDGDARVLVGR